MYPAQNELLSTWFNERVLRRDHLNWNDSLLVSRPSCSGKTKDREQENLQGQPLAKVSQSSKDKIKWSMILLSTSLITAGYYKKATSSQISCKTGPELWVVREAVPTQLWTELGLGSQHPLSMSNPPLPTLCPPNLTWGPYSDCHTLGKHMGINRWDDPVSLDRKFLHKLPAAAKEKQKYRDTKTNSFLDLIPLPKIQWFIAHPVYKYLIPTMCWASPWGHSLMSQAGRTGIWCAILPRF